MKKMGRYSWLRYTLLSVSGMKIKYSPDVDILSVQVSDEPVDYAEEAEGVIAHFNDQGKPVLLEIQGGKAFLLSSFTSLIKGEEISLS